MTDFFNDTDNSEDVGLHDLVVETTHMGLGLQEERGRNGGRLSEGRREGRREEGMEGKKVD